MTYTDYLQHWGILGQKWGQKNGPPYPLGSSQMSRAERRAEKKDAKWARKRYDKIYSKAYKPSKKELSEAINEIDGKVPKYSPSGKISKTYMNAVNKVFAKILSSKVTDMKAPSGKVVRFVAKRGEFGVHLALADPEYDMSQLKNGVYGSGRIAYRKKVVDRV